MSSAANILLSGPLVAGKKKGVAKVTKTTKSHRALGHTKHDVAEHLRLDHGTPDLSHRPLHELQADHRRFHAAPVSPQIAGDVVDVPSLVPTVSGLELERQGFGAQTLACSECGMLDPYHTRSCSAGARTVDGVDDRPLGSARLRPSLERTNRPSDVEPTTSQVRQEEAELAGVARAGGRLITGNIAHFVDQMRSAGFELERQAVTLAQSSVWRYMVEPAISWSTWQSIALDGIDDTLRYLPVEAFDWPLVRAGIVGLESAGE